MPTGTVRYILCPGCEASVRQLANTPCPHCQRCAFCGQKLPSDDAVCDCGLIDDSKRVEECLRRFEIPAEVLPRERRRLEIRHELNNRKMAINTIVGGVMAFILTIVYQELFGKPAANLQILYMALTVMSLIYLTTRLISRSFTMIETQRLEIEFPAEDDPYRRAEM